MKTNGISKRRFIVLIYPAPHLFTKRWVMTQILWEKGILLNLFSIHTTIDTPPLEGGGRGKLLQHLSQRIN